MDALQQLLEMHEGTDGVLDVRLRCEETGLDKSLEECSNKEVGTYGEGIAAGYLELRGYEILARNWRCVFGEADIVATDGNELVLVEVKTRKVDPDDNAYIAPEVSVDGRKRSKYEKIALMYFSRQTLLDVVRFDVIAIKLLGEHECMLRHLPAAYAWDR